MDKNNKYNYIFITTEDDEIRNQFILEIGKKLKYLISEKKIQYNYTNSDYLAHNKNVKGNINYMKIYLLNHSTNIWHIIFFYLLYWFKFRKANVLIISKCLDVICSRTAGSVGAFILSNGFRNTKVYYLGRYK